MVNELLKRDIVIYDGGMGTMLMRRGLGPSERADVMNITNPAAVEEVHRLYVDAGSNVICTNTFGANAIELKRAGYTVDEVVSAAVGAAKRASAGRALVALDLGPTGQFFDPAGDMTEEEAYELFREQAVAGEKAGADLAAVETMADLREVAAAVRAVRENTALEVFATMTFNADGRTMMGVSVEELAAAADELGVAAVGMNCSLAPSEMVSAARRLISAANIPVIIKLNAGLPDERGNYGTTPEQYADMLAPYVEMGAKVIGGCCGTTPEHIRRICELYKH